MDIQIIQQQRKKKKPRFLILGILLVVGIFCVVFQLILVKPSSFLSVFDIQTTRRANIISQIHIDIPQIHIDTATTTNNNNNNSITKCSAATAAEQQIKSSSLQQQEQQPFNVTGKGLCFIHVGKTGGGSFRKQFAKDKKNIRNLLSLPQLKFWREFHTERNLWINQEWYTKCDYFVAWVRNPISRIISAYNMIFDPEWIEHLNKVNKRYKKLTLLNQNRILNTYGNLNNIAESLFVDQNNNNNNDDDGKIININATTVLEGIEHIKHNIGWYFNSDSSGNALQPPVVATKMYNSNTNNNNVTTTTTTTYRREIKTNKLIVSRLSNPEFLRKLVFVGSTECYSDDIQRFMKMFGVDEKFTQENPIQHVHTSMTGGKFDHHTSISNLSSLAIENLRTYFSTDFDVLTSLIEDYNLIHCPKLIEKVVC